MEDFVYTIRCPKSQWSVILWAAFLEEYGSVIKDHYEVVESYNQSDFLLILSMNSEIQDEDICAILLKYGLKLILRESNYE